MLLYIPLFKRRLDAVSVLLVLLSGTASVAYAQQEAASQTFTIEAFDISGNKKLTELQIGEVVYPFLGPNKTINDIEGARKALEAAYRKLGLETVVVEIPIETQADGSAKLTAKFGIVPIKVTETAVGRVRVVGAGYYSPKLLKDQVPELKEGGVPDLRVMQAQINEANRNPDRQVTPLLKAGQVPGTIDVDLKVKDTLPFHASVELNNDHSAETSDLRLGATLRYTNLWQLGHSISGTYLVSPKDREESEIFSGSYLAPLWGTPWSFLLYGYTSNSNLATLGGTTVLGAGYGIGAQALVKLPSSENKYQSVNFGVEYKNSNQLTNLAALSITEDLPVYYPALVGLYSFQSISEKSAFSFSIGGRFGIRNIGIPDAIFKPEATLIAKADQVDAFCPAQDTPQVTALPTDFQSRTPQSFRVLSGKDDKGNDIFECYSVKRKLVGGYKFQNGDANGNSTTSSFVALKIEATYNRSIAKDFSAFIRFSGQLSDTAMAPGARFGVGGFTTVRGYYQSEALADEGFVGSFELRSPSLASYLGKYANELRVFGFVDGSMARIRSPGLEQIGEFNFLSVGVGARFKIFKYLVGDVVAGFPLLDGVTTKTGDQKIQFNVKADF